MTTPLPKGYGPKTNRPLVDWLLDWGAGILIAIVLLAVGVGATNLVVEPGIRGLGPPVFVGGACWLVGAALGVWLSVGQPLELRRLLFALLAVFIGSGLLLTPQLFALDAYALRAATTIAAMLLAPAFARLGLDRARASED